MQADASPSLRKLALHFLNIKRLEDEPKFAALKELNSALKKVEAQLTFNTFLMGDTMTLCDIFLIAESHFVLLQANAQKDLSNVARWLELMLSVPQVTVVLRR
jgi:glutathione S-transferase